MTMRASVLAACLGILGVAPIATAQTAPADEDGSRGPMLVERVHNGFAIMPEAKLTKVDGRSAMLAGASGGWMIDNTLLIGAGGYWLTNNSNGRRLAYGGAVVEWLQGADRRFGFAARGLVGGGTATLSDNVAYVRFSPDRRATPTTVQVRVERNLFIAEPQADLLVNLSRRIRLDWSVGYRLVGAEGNFDRRLRGVTGSVGLQIGGSRSARP
jgi:hypothetical protein